MDENSTHQNNSSNLASDLYDYKFFAFGNPHIYEPLLNGLLSGASSVGTAMNSFALLVISNTDYNKKLSLLFIAHQCVCDLVSSISMLGTSISNWSKVSSSYCYMIQSGAVVYIGLLAAVYNTVCLTGERYLMIVFPYKYRQYFTKKRALRAMVAIWLAAVITMIPITLVQGKCFFNPTKKSAVAHEIYGYIMVNMTFFIPLIVICVAYGHMLYIIHHDKHTQIAPEPSTSHTTNKVSEMSNVQMTIAPSTSQTINRVAEISNVQMTIAPSTSQTTNRVAEMANVQTNLEPSTSQTTERVAKVSNVPMKIGPSTSQTTNRIARMSNVQMKIFKTLLIVTVLFAVTWIPAQVYYLLSNIGVPLTFTDPLYRLTMVLVQINPCVNPLIYIYNFQEYRERAIALLKCRQKNRVVPKSAVLSSGKGSLHKQHQGNDQSGRKTIVLQDLKPTNKVESQTAFTLSEQRPLHKKGQSKGQSGKKTIRIQVQPSKAMPTSNTQG